MARDRGKQASGAPYRALILSTAAFTICFAVWTLFSIIGVKIKQELALDDSEFGLLVATPVLTGALSRFFLGLISDKFGGRPVFSLLMLLTAIAVYSVSIVSNLAMFLLAALGLGFAGGSFAVGVSYVSKWFDRSRQGTALGIFGAGTIGTAVTTFGAPLLVEAIGWRETVQVYAAVLALGGILFYVLSQDDPVTAARTSGTVKTKSLSEQLAPLGKLQVWRFSLYYFFVFGAFVALASWLPRYYMGMYGLTLAKAGLLTTAFALPAAAFRALGGWVADRIGARTVMYLTFIVSSIACFILSYPATDYVVHGIRGPIAFSFGITLSSFVILTIVLGFFMAIGMAAVYKHIPVYYPEHVGAVGGLVGAIGGLGGFFLPITFGVMNDLVGVWTSCFMLLFVLVSLALAWMHGAIRLMEHSKIRALHTLPALPEMAELNRPNGILAGPDSERSSK
ncbi:MAG: NarK/NasA family nitrate transporter [Alphaproteobacteria bacterium]|nr:NarK/NasA family nitrate transporter [Alphaproteobacteria bacterium]